MSFNVSGADAGYAYSLGMVSGLYGRLLKPRDFEAMVLAASASEAASLLDGTGYGDAIRGLKGGYGLADLEEALAGQLLKSYIDVLSSVPRDDRAVLDSIILGGFDIDNLLTVCRAVTYKTPVEETMGMLFPYGRMGREELVRLASQPAIEDIPEKVGKPYSDLIRRASQYKESMPAFEEDLLRGFIEGLIEDSSGIARDYVMISVDVLNMRTIIRCRMAGIEPAGHVLRDGYHLDRNKMAELLRQDISGILKVLEDTPYYLPLKESMPQMGVLDFGAFDNRMRAAVAMEADNLAILNPLSAGSVIAYIRAKEGEVRRIRSVLTGKWLGLATADMKVMLS